MVSPQPPNQAHARCFSSHRLWTLAASLTKTLQEQYTELKWAKLSTRNPPDENIE